MKKTGALLLLLAAMMLAVPAYNGVWAAQSDQDGQAAQEQVWGQRQRAYGWQHPAIAPEKRAAFEKIISEYREKAQPLYNDMWAKRTELNYLSRNDKTDPKDISKMVADMKNTREKSQDLRKTAAGKLSKDLDISTEHAYALLGGGACGMGPGMGGYGMGRGGCGMGPGMGGYGRGGYGNDGPRWQHGDGPKGWRR